MPHLYNRSAFRPAVGSSPLLELYCALIVLEVALKDRMPAWAGGHDVPDFVNRAGESALALRLRTGLAAFWCTDRYGNEARVAPERYPDLRYLRHEGDFAGKTTDVDLRGVLVIVKDIETVLTAKGRL